MRDGRMTWGDIVRRSFYHHIPALAILLVAPVAFGTAPGFKQLDFVIDEATFEKTCEELELDAAACGAVQGLHRQYWNDILKIDEETEANILKVEDYPELRELKQKELEERMRRPDGLPPEISGAIDEEEIARRESIEYEVNVERLKGRQLADERFELLLTDLTLQLNLSEGEATATRRYVRRVLFTRDIREEPSTQDFTYWIDIIPLIELASVPGNELHVLRRGEASERLKAIVTEYELRLDSIIDLEMETKSRQWPRRGERTFHTPKANEWTKVMDQTSARFSRRYDNLSATVNEIILLLLDNDASQETVETWIDRFNSAVFPRLYRDTCLTDVCRWLAKRDDHTKNQLEAVTELYELYATELAARRRTAVIAAVQLRRHHFPPNTQNMTQVDAFYVTSLHAIGALSRQTADSIRTILGAEQCADFDQQIIGEGFRHGPIVSPDWLRAAGIEEDAEG